MKIERTKSRNRVVTKRAARNRSRKMAFLHVDALAFMDLDRRFREYRDEVPGDAFPTFLAALCCEGREE